MKKYVVCAFIAGFSLLSLSVAAEKPNTSVEGFADIYYTLTDESADVPGGKNPVEGKFAANGEVDFSLTPKDGVTARVDVDLTLDPTTSANIEQAFFAWKLTKDFTLIGGVFNNPIGADAEDAPDMDFVSHSIVYGILNHQTALPGNNIAGVALATKAGAMGITAALLNDLNQTDEEKSFALVLNSSPMKGLDLELGMVTQADQQDNPTSAETVFDLNAKYSMGKLTLGLDYLSPAEIIDSAYAIWAGYDLGNGMGAKIRYDSAAWANANIDDTTAMTLSFSYQAASNLLISLEYQDRENTGGVLPVAVTGIDDGALMLLDFVTTF